MEEVIRDMTTMDEVNSEINSLSSQKLWSSFNLALVFLKDSWARGYLKCSECHMGHSCDQELIESDALDLADLIESDALELAEVLKLSALEVSEIIKSDVPDLQSEAAGLDYNTGTIRNSRQRASSNDTQTQFLLPLLKCSPRARRGRWSEDAWKTVPQVMKEKFSSFNFTIQQFKTLVMLYNQVGQMSMRPGFIWDNKNCLLHSWRDCYRQLVGEGLINNLNSSSTIPLSLMLGNLQIHPVDLQSFAPLSINIPPCGVFSLDYHESKRVSNSDCEMGHNLILSAPLHPVPASNSQQPEKHKPDNFSRKKPTRKFRGKPKCKKMCAAKSDFSLMRCMKALNKLREFKECDMEHVLEIFSDELYREAFIAMKKSQKVFWLRSKIDEGKGNRSVDHSVASISGCLEIEN